LRGWLKEADVDRSDRDGLTTEDRAELMKLRRENRTLAMENENLSARLPTSRG
jgi:transposase-like protein